MVNTTSYSHGDQVRSPQFGLGTVRFDEGDTVLVQFSHGIESCEKFSLAAVLTPIQALQRPSWDSPQEVIARVQAHAIQSANDVWGVFSRSRIQLLPHQLWVCRRVLEQWPTRWLVADDVGLGKTIEAGLILWPLLSRQRIRRLLILCPASLVEQWQSRLKEMFDIPLSRYLPDLDNDRVSFWDTYNMAVASLHTLRKDHAGRKRRLLESEPWDMVMVDEAHHLNSDEQSGPTLSYRLVQEMLERDLVRSMVFFTGTPHRGKDYGFWSLLRLLRPDLFDPRQPATAQLPHLGEVMIRNNKQNVTDLKGDRLFLAPKVGSETYTYSQAESDFYNMLTKFIRQGQAYASSLPTTDSKAVMLVLIAMQKLASSSVAAIRRAMSKRLQRILDPTSGEHTANRGSGSRRQDQLQQYEETDATGDIDALSEIEEELVSKDVGLKLMADEEPHLRALIDAADQVQEETKVSKILSILDESFRDRTVLLFTEYKATQSLVMSALMQRFGDGCVTFINGDERAEDVVDSRGLTKTINTPRHVAAEAFNKGDVRFLISTEAGGEGIDLQENCHSLIHIDLPWNPMRMHQRVGRLNRYGQTEQVEVISLHNPDTVESLIWEKLNQKIESIMRAFQEVMEEPEDLMEMVLGMTSPSVFRDLFSGAQRVPREQLSDWFDQESTRFGGKDVVETVKDIVGHAAKFDFQQVSEEVPKVDLPELKPFFRLLLTVNNRQVREDENGVSFKTPDKWRNIDSRMRSSYDQLTFDRETRGRNGAARVVGVGHPAFDAAMKQAIDLNATVSALPADVLARPIVVYAIRDRVTTQQQIVRSVIVGIELTEDGAHVHRDWELLEALNHVLIRGGIRRLRASGVVPETGTIEVKVRDAKVILESEISKLDLPFKIPESEPLAVLWPSPGVH